MGEVITFPGAAKTEPAATQPNQEAVQVLERLIAQARQGQLRGFVLAGEDHEGAFTQRCSTEALDLADLLASLKLEEQNVMKLLHSQSAEDDD
jgi:hypothetical protein